MTEPPRLARELLRAAAFLAPANKRTWVDAMQGDLDAAHAEGRALTWALGCLIAAVRFRAAGTFALSQRRRQAALTGVVLLVLSAIGSLSYYAVTGDSPLRGGRGTSLRLILLCTPLIVTAVSVAWMIWRADRVGVVDDRWIRRSFIVLALAAACVSLSFLHMLSGSRFSTILAVALSTNPLAIVVALCTGALATMASAIVLLRNFRCLPRRIPRALPIERPWVLFWGAERNTMLALLDAGAPEMTFPRAWLLQSTATTALLLMECGVQLIGANGMQSGTIGQERFLTMLCVGDAMLCAANTAYVLAHVRFARRAHEG